MSNTLDHKCPSCNAVLKFNPHGQNWKCEYCRSEFNFEQIEEYEKKTGKILEQDATTTNDMDLYLCKNCGAAIIADPNVSTTSCVYCKNTTILKDKLQGEFSPDYVIPFRYTKEDAIKSFKDLGKKRKLMPKAFSDKKNIAEMSGIYIPFWLYDYDANGVVEANCNRITTWRSGDYRYTKTDTYLVTRGGNLSFENIPVDGSKRFANDIMNSIEPFDYKDMKKFNYSYLSGFLAEKYDVNNEEAIQHADLRARNSFTDEMLKDMIGYNTKTLVKKDVNLTNTSSKYVLLPVWMLNIKYKDKIYIFAMNGQTGKLIGNIPVDPIKAILFTIGVFVSIVFILSLITYLYTGGAV